MSINVNSITDSYNAWYDYRYGKNTRGLTADDIAQIETRWKDNIASWKSQASKDENKYEITDDEADNAKKNGKEKAANEAGFNGEKEGCGAIVGGYAGGIVGSAGAAVGAGMVASLASKGASQVKTTHLAGALILAGVGTALYAVAKIIRGADPNGEQAQALKDLYESILPDAEGQLSDAQANMEDASEEVINLTEEANANNEDTNEEIENSKAEFDMYRESVEIITQKLQNGEPLTDAEKEFLKEAVGILEELGIHINEIADINTEETQDIYDKIGGYQDTFDESAESMEEVQGIIDYAAGFDSATISNTENVAEAAKIGKTGSTVTAAGGLGVITIGAIKAKTVFGSAEGIGMMIAGGVASAMGYMASSEFGKIQVTQNEYNTIARNELGFREGTQNIKNSVNDFYDEQIDVYDDNISIVEDLEMDIPDDLEVPDTTTQPPVTVGGESDGNGNAGANAGGNVSGTSNNDTGTNDPKKDKKEVK